ncbi:hypothetical protein CA54_22630 [Symmachiella macrocystis]|uniref:Uncharacterized protein n=1 Tax=Symmachiella macrocystis TaxID=2527985 RepID=A0A5C6BMY3_9PLAN|nr:phytanoyl-CoA dioxygenase family protein [Symmachiella macrocystis]TWU13428.1 hypothetical protein CA54_22630 [Symmachiella macrocystis]
METTPPHSIDTREDSYPSRVYPEPEFLKRCDPIVCDFEAPGPLSTAQLSQFERDGFLILPAFFPETDIATYKEEIKRLCASREIQQRPEAILEPNHCELR